MYIKITVIELDDNGKELKEKKTLLDMSEVHSFEEDENNMYVVYRDVNENGGHFRDKIKNTLEEVIEKLKVLQLIK